MKHVVKAISLTCDGCGQTFETLDGMVCYADDEDAKRVKTAAVSDNASEGSTDQGGDNGNGGNGGDGGQGGENEE